ncbi:MAG: phosphoribosylformylglycinamidine synthase [Candidatus Tokpelaia sp. JSC189]|nr:MAG: phosphoribosylformylglycinamidine synthase [Candidatus Tokpelaia sp. JSC189]
MKARVTVTLKTGVLDPQGKAILSALGNLAFNNVQSVRQGKVFDIILNENDIETARKQLETMCEKLLVNTVIENYYIEFFL